METVTSDRKVLMPEVRVSGNRFTVVSGTAQSGPAVPEVSRGGAGSSLDEDAVSDEKTGIIPRHVWG